MAELTNADYWWMRDFTWATPPLKENMKELMNDRALNVSNPTMKQVYQAFEDWTTSIALDMKAAAETVLGGPITNAQAKDLGRTYYAWKATQ